MSDSVKAKMIMKKKPQAKADAELENKMPNLKKAGTYASLKFRIYLRKKYYEYQ